MLTSMTSRVLTEGEIAMARESFGDRVDYAQVRIRRGPGHNPVALLARRNGNPAITLVNTIHMLDEDSAADFSLGGNRMLFMHEMTHIWQYDTLGVPRFFLRYGREYARSGFDAKAMYRYDEGKTRFAGAMLEAQAEMVSHYGEAVRKKDATWIARLKDNLAGTGLYGL
jgi:hypothetical protein